MLALATTGWLAPTAGAAPPARARRAKQAVTPTPAAGQLPGVAPLADCLRSGRPLLTLFLIDTSGSLQETDPTNQRVAGVKTALEGLASLQATTIGKLAAQIEVQLDGFSVGLNPAPQWTTLTNSTLASVDSQADTFASQNTGQDTDYYAALSGARQALANQAATLPSSQNPCKTIFWFTDGQYDVIDRIDAQEAATLGATKSYAPDIDLTMPGGGQALIARGKQLLCEPGGLDDQMRADGIVTVAVAIDTQIAPSDQAFLTAVATGNGCGTLPSTPTGASLETGDLSQLVLSFNAVANGTAGGTQVGGTTTVTPCPGKPCAAGTQRVSIDKTLNRATLLSLASNPGIDMLITAPGIASPLRITAGNSGTASLGSTTVRFVWINAQTCSLELDLGASAAGQWQIVFIAPATLTTPGTVQTQLHVYADITPHLLATPALRVGSQGHLRPQHRQHPRPSDPPNTDSNCSCQRDRNRSVHRPPTVSRRAHHRARPLPRAVYAEWPGRLDHRHPDHGADHHARRHPARAHPTNVPRTSTAARGVPEARHLRSQPQHAPGHGRRRSPDPHRG